MRRRALRALHVWMNGQEVGTWSVSPQGEQQFLYAEEWVASPYGRPLSLSMPLRPGDAPYRREVVESFFDNLLPDNDAIRRRMMARFGTTSARPFELLTEVGRDCVGAVQLLGLDESPGPLREPQGESLNDSDIEDVLRGVAATGIGASDEGDFRISLAGNQEKTALLRHKGRWMLPLGTTPTTHIFKLPMGDASVVGVDLSTSVENEWLCAQILLAMGIPTAPCEMRVFGEQRVLVVERFDRRLVEGRWLRLPQEDFCQATGTPSARKYEKDGGPGIERLMHILQGSSRAHEDRSDLFRTLFVFWVLCAIDGHAKNFSLFIEPRGAFHLTPRYDVLSAYPFLGHGKNKLAEQKVKMAMAMLGKNRHYRWREIRLEHWLETARQCGLPHRGEDIVAEVLGRLPLALDEVFGKLPKDFPTQVSGPIFDGATSAIKRALQASR